MDEKKSVSPRILKIIADGLLFSLLVFALIPTPVELSAFGGRASGVYPFSLDLLVSGAMAAFGAIAVGDTALLPMLSFAAALYLVGFNLLLLLCSFTRQARIFLALLSPLLAYLCFVRFLVFENVGSQSGFIASPIALIAASLLCGLLFGKLRFRSQAKNQT